MSQSPAELRAADHFKEATKNHQMTVLHDDGLYRHLRFRNKESWAYGFDIITWPGCLAIEGDIPSGLIFARIEDMFDFFASGPGINPQYWAEKITNRAYEAEVYSRRALDARVREEATNLATNYYEDDTSANDVLREWQQHIDRNFYDLDDERGAQQALADFSRFHDTWEWHIRDWDHVFLLVCHAVRHAAVTYREWKAKQPQILIHRNEVK